MDAPADLRITITDIRKAGFCAKGARRWLEGYGFDFRDFLKNGAPVADILATGDGQAQQVVEIKLRNAADGR